ncbi:MAG: polyprenyl synthetase family protein [Limnobacter sp.]|nr:polyprenyl synthetase family protein [Limnobacter sp.]
MSPGAAQQVPADWLSQTRDELESYLAKCLGQLDQVDPVLSEAMAYSLLNGGKRLRACLVLATGQALEVPVPALMPAAAAIEAVHAYSLVHDDMPCMDNDTMRRGKPTSHVKYGQAMALLTGDALQTLAFEWLSGNALLTDKARLSQVQVLAKAAGAQGMANGQAIDLRNVGQPMTVEALKHMHARKTGDLILASVRMGYLACETLEKDRMDALEEYAKALGLAYQVLDDILDVEASSEELGKTSGKDAAANKPTMVSLLGLEQAKALLNQLKESAEQACVRLNPVHSCHLYELIQLITQRKS